MPHDAKRMLRRARQGSKLHVTWLLVSPGQTRSEKEWQIIANSWDPNGGPVAKHSSPNAGAWEGTISGWELDYYMSN